MTKQSSTAVGIKTIKTSTCKTLNGKSTLEYAIGKDAEQHLYYRISKNAGGGHYSQEWLPQAVIEPALAAVQPITSLPLRALCKGKSVNTSGFLLAVLLAEGVVERMPGKAKHYRFPVAAVSGTPKTKAVPKPVAKTPAKAAAKVAKKPAKASKK